MARAKQTDTQRTVAKEIKVFRDTLKANNQVAHESEPLPPSTTHVKQKDGKLKRKRYSAVSGGKS